MRLSTELGGAIRGRGFVSGAVSCDRHSELPKAVEGQDRSSRV